MLTATIVLFSCNKEKSVPLETYACMSEYPSPKGDRLVGIDLLDLTESNTFDDNMAHASRLGIYFIQMHSDWKIMFFLQASKFLDGGLHPDLVTKK